MQNSIRDLNQVPFSYVKDQLSVRLAGGMPSMDYNSMQELKNIKTQDGDDVDLTPAEQQAIFLRHDNFHIIYPSTMTKTQIKVFEQFRKIPPIHFTNTYKLVRTKIYSLSQEIKHLKKSMTFCVTTQNNKPKEITNDEFQKYININLTNIFKSFEGYIKNPIGMYLDEARVILKGLITDLDVVNYHKNQLDDVKLSKVCEFNELLMFLYDCTNDPDTFMPHLLMPCDAFPSIPIKSERVKNLFIESGVCMINGFDVFIDKIDSLTIDLFNKQEETSDKPQKKSKAKKQLEKNAAQINCQKPIKAYVEKIKRIFAEWKSYYASIYDKRRAIEWTNCLAQIGCINVIDM